MTRTRTQQLQAERDGWELIATRLLRAAYGGEWGGIPPVELLSIELPAEATEELGRWLLSLQNRSMTSTLVSGDWAWCPGSGAVGTNVCPACGMDAERVRENAGAPDRGRFTPSHWAHVPGVSGLGRRELPVPF